jgi:glycerol uptake facilitator-like aquaporin
MDEVSWYDVPAVQILGAILGTLLLVAAVRSMFGRRK